MDLTEETINIFIKDKIIDRITIISKNKFDVFFKKEEKGLRFKILNHKGCNGFFEFKSNPSLFIGKKLNKIRFCGRVLSEYKRFTYKCKFYFKNKEYLGFYMHCDTKCEYLAKGFQYSCVGGLCCKIVDDVDSDNSSEDKSEYSNNSYTSDFYEEKQ